MSAQLSGAGVNAPTTRLPSAPLTQGWDEITEPARDTMMFGPRFVPRQLVHKTTAGHVLLTDAIRLAENRFLVAAMLPPDRGRRHREGTDPMLVAEALRQAAYYIQHCFYGVPNSHQFILGEITLGLEDTAPLSAGPRWLSVNLSVTCTPTAKRTSRRLGLRLEVELSVAGHVCGRGSLLSDAVVPGVYQAIRRRAAAPMITEPAPVSGRPLSPGTVGRHSPSDVLLIDDGTAGSWLLRVDQGNPEMFDHPVDHVPGMVLLEAFRQAALTATGSPAAGRTSLTGLRAEFAKFCELGMPARITVEPRPGHPVADRMLVRVAAEQAGAEVASGTIELALGADTRARVNR